MVHCSNNVNVDTVYWLSNQIVVIKFSLKKCWLSSVYHKDHRCYLTIISSYCTFTDLQLHRFDLLQFSVYLIWNLRIWSVTFVCIIGWQILHSTGLEFQHQVQEAKDLDQLIKIHYRYLATIHDRCLLREKVKNTDYPRLKRLFKPSDYVDQKDLSVQPLNTFFAPFVHTSLLRLFRLAAELMCFVFPGQFCEGGHNEGSQSSPHLLWPMAGWFWGLEVRIFF